MGIDRDSQEAVGGVCIAFDRSASGDPQEDIYYIGMYYVRPQWRHSGLGTLLFEKVMKIAGDVNTVLNGVLKMSPLYASKYGFNKMLDYKHNFVSIPTEYIMIQAVADSLYILKDLRDVKEVELIAYDVAISHRNRGKYFMNFITTGKCFTKVALDTSGKIVGIGCVRTVYSNDLCAGPIFADNETIAKSLLGGILSMIPDLKKYKMLTALYPAVNEDATRLFKSIGGTQTKTVQFSQCQFTKKVFPTNDIKVFAMTECACSIV
ncbi:hypothetical protein KIN20_001092 [Parelaphostrongylus tenuis]|uniref:N-acetyltransferase domain-containing protein n=1 Tax=Parelaphostrongylus tenuis TaxID=148309 RepID=A0AAD5QCD4_PARTN|nr:hypothetical protein KIN20_001092 [Parelaphostrongylus tenuis]